MNRKIVFLSLLLTLTFVFSACMGPREISELGISLIMALDIEEDKILLTAEIVDPAYTQQSDQGSGQGSYVKYVQGTGNTVFEAFRDITLKFDRRIFASHNKVLLFGEELAKRGLVTHIDELFRDREQRESANILIAKDRKAYELMGVNSGLEEIPALYISNLIDNVKGNPKAVDINMVNFLKHYYHKGHQPIAGVIEKKKRKQVNETMGKVGTQDYELSIIGSAVFDEGVLVGYLNGNETKSLNFLMNNIKSGIITFPTPVPPSDKETNLKSKSGDLSSMIIIKSKTKNDIEIKDGNIAFKTKIKLRGALGEVIGGLDVSRKENIKEIEKACSRKVEEGIKNTVTNVQKDFGLDIFGFALVFHRKYPDEWKKVKENWDEIFSEADFEVEVKTEIIRTGLINTPVIKEKRK